jgi:hypothetical protein
MAETQGSQAGRCFGKPEEVWSGKGYLMLLKFVPVCR